ncbi:MAG: MerR family DNA-binding transcriptional regulator [Bacillota bacterium]|nr:MerR family DNA-binding transcriptional regulator [Bacillota bacterium]MDW7682715.1 MerR family DNA-binding transcriptional regulator [Bacillota bacterium]
MEEQLFSISQLAADFDITPRTIRYYEEVGLLESQRESVNHQRLYDVRARARLKLILRGKRFGFSLDEIGEMVNLYDADPTQKEQLQRTIAFGEKKIKELEEMIRELQETKEELVLFRDRFRAMLDDLEKGDG